MIRNAKELVSLPEVYYRAQEMLDDPNFDAQSLAGLLKPIQVDQPTLTHRQ